MSGQVGLIPGVSEYFRCILTDIVQPTQIALGLQTKDFAGGDDVEAQAEQVMLNLGAILSAGGSSFASVVKTTVLLADMGDFQKVNAIYGNAFTRADMYNTHHQTSSC